MITLSLFTNIWSNPQQYFLSRIIFNITKPKKGVKSTVHNGLKKSAMYTNVQVVARFNFTKTKNQRFMYYFLHLTSPLRPLKKPLIFAFEVSKSHIFFVFQPGHNRILRVERPRGCGAKNSSIKLRNKREAVRFQILCYNPT